MFVRKKKHRSGTTRVVVNKSIGVFKELVTIGVSKDEAQIEQLNQQANNWIDIHTGTRDIFKEQARTIEEEKLARFFYQL